MQIHSARFFSHGLSALLGFSLVLIQGAAILSAQTPAPSLSGTVRDPQNRPVPGASITLYSPEGGAVSSTTSDPNGRYRFSTLAPVDYLLRAEALGFAAFVDDAIHLTAGALVIRDVALKIAGVQSQVVVTASGTPQTPDQVSKAITVVERADADQRDAFAVADAVDLAPGIRVQELGGPGSLATIHIRGLRDQDTAILVDGLRMRDPSAVEADASGLIEDLLFTNASRVEVLNGAGSSLYGTSAIGGVVNILTEEGGGRTRGSVLLDGGSLGAMRARAEIAGSALADRLQYSAGLASIDVVNGIDNDDPYRDTSLQSRVGFRITPSTLLSARLYAADSFAKLNTDPVLIPEGGSAIVNAIPLLTFTPGADDPDSRRAGRFLDGALVLSGQPTPKLHYQVSAQTLENSRRYNDGPAGQGFQPSGSTRTLYDGRIQTLNAQVNYKLGQYQLLTGGYEFENENYAYDFFDLSNPGAASATWVTQRSNSVFAQDQISLFGGRLQAAGGFRAQYFGLDAPSFSPSASAPYQGISFSAPPAAYTGDGSGAYFFRKTGTKIRAHVGRGYRAPSLYERFGASFDSFFGYSNFGDPLLKPEHSLSFDGGIDQMFANGRARVSATYFYTRLDQIITFASLAGTDPYGRFAGYVNGQGGLSRGVELSGTLSPLHSLQVTAAYTYVNAIESTPYGNDLQTFVIPRHQFTAMVTERLGSRILLTFDTLDSGTYLEPLFAADFSSSVVRFGGIRRINAGASYRIPLSEFRAVKFQIRGENLTGQTYYENGFMTPGRTAYGGAKFEF